MKTHRILRRIAGGAFVLAGAFKVLLWAWHLVQPSAPNFAAALAQLGVPFAEVFALGVPLIEIVGGYLILRGQLIRLSAAVLAIDMIVAIALVGLPGLLGRSLRIGEQAIGQEAWRLPLELVLLTAMLWLIWKPGEAR